MRSTVVTFGRGGDLLWLEHFLIYGVPQLKIVQYALMFLTNIMSQVPNPCICSNNSFYGQVTRRQFFRRCRELLKLVPERPLMCLLAVSH